MPDRNESTPAFDRKADVIGALLLFVVFGLAVGGIRGGVVAAILVLGVTAVVHFATTGRHHQQQPPTPPKSY